MNISAIFNVFGLLRNPSLCLPHATVPTFDRVPVTIATALTAANKGQRPNIRAVVLDKDNCFAEPKRNSIHKPYKVRPIKLPRFPLPSQLLSGMVPGLVLRLEAEQDQAVDDHRNIFDLFAKSFLALMY